MLDPYAAGEAERAALATANSELRSVTLRLSQTIEQCEWLAGELARIVEAERAMADGLARLVLDLLAGRPADRSVLAAWGRSRGLHADVTSHLTDDRAFTEQEDPTERSNR